MTPEIKIASIEDLEVLLPLVRAFHEFEDLHITEEKRENSITALLVNVEIGGIWPIYDNRQPVGYIALCLDCSIEFAGKDAL
jgi:hypothetical protein